MRHKQRPTKSSRHKSVTCIIDSHTSFGDYNESQHHRSLNLYKNTQPHHHATSPTPSSPQPPLFPTYETTRIQDSYLSYRNDDDYATTSDASPRYTMEGSHNDFDDHQAGTSSSSNYHGRTDTYFPSSFARKTIIATNGEHSKHSSALLRKQFEHNYRHMSDVMRLAFLENNDISIDDITNIDYNSLSTASLLQRNIQQQIQQERRDQLQLRRQQQQELQKQIRKHQQEQQQRLQRQTELLLPIDHHIDHLNQIDPVEHTDPIDSIDPIDAIDPIDTIEPSGPRYIEDFSEGFSCNEPGCGKSFPSLRKLRHHKVVHSDEFPFVCEFQGCAKKFKRKFGIDLHSTTHFDLDPDMYSKTSNNSSLPFFGRRMQYSMCKPCGQKFKTVHEYQYHMLKHGKEPFKCPVKGCGQTFSIWKSFQKHRASHYFNYYCKMDPQCDHQTSNLQLLKLHIYCCHFRRKLPENATLASRDQPEDDHVPEESGGAIDQEDGSQPPLQMCYEDNTSFDDQAQDEDLSHDQEHDLEHDDPDFQPDFEHGPELKPKLEVEPIPETPRRDSRLRKNPPRSNTFKQQDYASINNGTSFARSVQTTPQSKRTRSAVKRQQRQQQAESSIDMSYMEDDDFEMSETGIFATTTPASSKTSSSGGNSRRTSRALSSSGKKRTKAVTFQTETHNPVKQEIDQNHGEGYFCDEPGCGKSFPSLRKLRHHKVVHSDEFPFVCEFQGCAKKFKRKFGIDLHSTTHFDLDPDMYSKTSNNSSLPFFGRRMQHSMCKPCGQKFKTVHEYQYHMLKHGKEPFKCPVKGCGQTFSIWKSFQKHRASHYFNYYCKIDPQCDHHTSNLQLLKLHIYCCHFRRTLPDNATLASKDEDLG